MLDSDSNHCAFHQSTQYHTVGRLKACDNVIWGGGAYSSARTLLEPAILLRSSKINCTHVK